MGELPDILREMNADLQSDPKWTAIDGRYHKLTEAADLIQRLEGEVANKSEAYDSAIKAWSKANAENQAKIADLEARLKVATDGLEFGAKEIEIRDARIADLEERLACAGRGIGEA